MFQKFFTDTIESKFIKALLENSPVPVYPSVPMDGFVINGCMYTSKYGIIRCTKTGKLSSNFVRIYPYVFGQFYQNFTERYVSKYNYYDTKTHEYLGEYLRLYRDLFGIDLMPFYNCFSYRFIEDMYLTKSNRCGYEIGNNKSYKVVAIPIKFDKKYTVSIDSQSTVLIKAIFHDNLGHLVQGIGDNESEATELLKVCQTEFEFNGNKQSGNNDGVIAIPFMSFNSPFKFEIKLNSSMYTDAYKRKLKRMEKYLYLTVQLPSDNYSSIVAIEGDYENGDNSTNFYNIENINDAVNDILDGGTNFIKSNLAISNSSDAFNTVITLMDKSSNDTINKFMHTDLSLLEMSTSNIYAFSDRLVEYLLLNVVDSEDTIDNNTIKTQKIMKMFDRTDTTPSVWSDMLRFSLYKDFVENSPNTFDVNGFVDKDVEKMLIGMDGDF